MPILNNTQAGVQPTVQLTSPYTPPAHTIEAGSIEEMVSFSALPLDWTYEIGTKPSDEPFTVVVTNWCIRNELRVGMSFPSYLTANTPFPFIIPPLSTYTIKFSLNEEDAKGRVVTGQKLFTEAFSVAVVPLNVIGPVYVKPQS